MSSQITPLVRKMKQGTFITFQSSGEDLTFTMNNSSNRKLKFSKFALLDIPAIVTSANGVNSIQFKNIDGVFTEGLSTASPPPAGDQIDLSESLQNYMLNMETLLIRSSGYNPLPKLTVSERIFFKWLKEIGAIRYRTGTVNSEVSANATIPLFTEENNNSNSSNNLYNRVVKYIGEIDMDSSLMSSTNSQKEVYIYIPTQNGSTPTILFKSVADENYYAGMTVRKTDNINTEYIAGRSSGDDPTLAGLSVIAQYDMDVALGTYDYTVNGTTPGTIWFQPMASNGPDSYFTDLVFGDPATDTIIRTDSSTTDSVTYLRSRLDGVMLDFNKADYHLFDQNPLIDTFNGMNSTALANSFSFNAVLVYYDLYDPNNLEDTATNLFGVMFLNDLQTVSSGGSKVGSYEKIKPNAITKQQGNGYGFKLNLKIDVTADSVDFVEVEVSVNDYNTFSMLLFADTMQRISETNNKYERMMLTHVAVSQRLDEMESLILNDTNKIELVKDIETLKEQLSGIIPDEETSQLLATVNQRIDDILQGNTTIPISMALDVRAFDGLRMELTNKQLSLRNTRQKYSMSLPANINVGVTQSPAYNILKLGPADTLHYHKNNNISKTAANNVNLYVDDTEFQWKTNQSLILTVLEDINMQSFGFIIYTDALNRKNLSGNYQYLIGTVPEVNTKRPIIEIICVNADTMEFVVMVK